MNCVHGRWFIGGRVISVVFHPFDGVLLIVDGPFLALLPSSLSAVSKLSSVSSTTSNIKKRLVLDNNDHRGNTKPKYQEPKSAAYDLDWFYSSATKNKCIKHTSIKNLPDTQEGQLTFLLGKFKTSEIKTAFADAISKVGKPARTPNPNFGRVSLTLHFG